MQSTLTDEDPDSGDPPPGGRTHLPLHLIQNVAQEPPRNARASHLYVRVVNAQAWMDGPPLVLLPVPGRVRVG